MMQLYSLQLHAEGSCAAETSNGLRMDKQREIPVTEDTMIHRGDPLPRRVALLWLADPGERN